jgi:hypothetical protein
MSFVVFMLLDGKEIEIRDVEAFFAVMDTFEKQVLSTNVEKGVPKTDRFCVFVVSDHAVGLPLDAPEKLKKHLKYI